MKVTVVGCGDAWGTQGRNHTCFRVDAEGKCVLVDFGASAIVAFNRMGYDPRDVDAIVLSHLHGDHFGGVPFFLFQCQFETQRGKPLTIYGPPGSAARIQQALEVFYPGERQWRFAFDIVEVEPGKPVSMPNLGELQSVAVEHSSGALSTGVKLTIAGKTFAYSGDTQWTPALIELARDADLFIVECYSGNKPVPGHIDWPTLEANLSKLRARRIALTHMGESALARQREMSRSGVTLLEDGLVLEV